VFSEDMIEQAEQLIATCRKNRLIIATAESCTGGLVAGLLTEIAGSSAVVDRGFVTYSNAAKQAMLAVPPKLIEQHGAVSEPVARAMAEGALGASNAGISIAITGIAGPGGDSPDKPVGTVHLACASRHQPTIHRACQFGPMGGGTEGRTAIRLASVRTALAMLAAMADDAPNMTE
jgi:nicotinamide-nucleotide amidase